MKFKSMKYGISIAILLCMHALQATTYPQYVFTEISQGTAAPFFNQVGVYNASSNSRLGEGVITMSSTSSRMTGLAITANGRYLYGAARTSSTNVQVICGEVASGIAVATLNITVTSSAGGNPVLALTPDGKYLLGTCNQKIFVIDTATNTQVGTPTTLTGLPLITNTHSLPIAISPNVTGSGYSVFVSNNALSGSGANPAVLPLTVSLSGSVSLGTAFNVGTGLGGAVAFTPDGSTLYVAHNPDVSYSNRQLYPVNPSTFVVGSPITISETNFAVALVIAPNGQTAYVITANSSGEVNVINLATQTYTTTITLTNAFIQQVFPCTCAAFNADGSKLYVVGGVALYGLLYLYAFDTASNTYTSIASGVGDSQYSVVVGQGFAGALDPSFGNQGYTLTPLSRADSIQDLAIQSDDKILVTGTTQKAAPSLYLARYTANGILDTSTFNAASTPGYSILQPSSLSPAATACAGNAMALDASSNILVAGFAAQNPTSILLARYTSSGVLDTTFNSGGALPGVVTQAIASGVTASAVGVQSGTYSNRIIVGGTVVSNGVPGFLLAAFNASTGALDTTFGGNGTGYRIDNFGNISILKAMVIEPSTAVYGTPDAIYVTGNVDNQIWVAKYDPTGNLLASAAMPPLVAAGSYLGSTGLFTLSLVSSSAYDIAYVDNTFEGVGQLYIAGSAMISVDNQPAYFPGSQAYGGTLILANQLQSLVLCLNTDLTLDTQLFAVGNNGAGSAYGFYIQSTSNGSEFYSVALQSNKNIVLGGYAIGDLANQLSVAGFFGFNTNLTNYYSFETYGIPNVYWNNNSSPSLQTIGSLTAARRVRCQSTNNVITAGTADGTYCIARFFGS